MIFETHRSVVDNVFSTSVVFKKYGNDDTDDKALSETQELALVNDFGNPSINPGNIVFEGYFKVDTDKRVVPGTEPTTAVPVPTDSVKVSFVMNSKKIEIAPSFEAAYTIDARDIETGDLDDKILTTRKLVAEARCLLFETKIKKAISDSVTALKAQRTRFESDPVANLIV